MSKKILGQSSRSLPVTWILKISNLKVSHHFFLNLKLPFLSSYNFTYDPTLNKWEKSSSSKKIMNSEKRGFTCDRELGSLNIFLASGHRTTIWQR